MARLQVLPLPVEIVGEMSTTPYILVLDDAADLELTDLEQDVAWLTSASGARGVLVFDKRIEVVTAPTG